MWCYIYRSPKKENSYLYIAKENDFTDLPETLMRTFGQPIFVMKLLLDQNRKLVAGSVEEIKEKLNKDGFFLQMLNDDDFAV